MHNIRSRLQKYKERFQFTVSQHCDFSMESSFPLTKAPKSPFRCFTVKWTSWTLHIPQSHTFFSFSAADWPWKSSLLSKSSTPEVHTLSLHGYSASILRDDVVNSLFLELKNQLIVAAEGWKDLLTIHTSENIISGWYET